MLVAKDKRQFRVIFYLIIFLFLSTLNFNFSKEEKKDLIFPITNIEVNGIEKIDKDELLKSLNIFYDKNIFAINEKEIRKILEKNNLIENFKVKRNYPNKLTFNIEEAKIIGIILKDKKKYFLTSHEKIVSFDEKLNNKELPIIYGKNASKFFKKFNILLKKNNFDLNLIKNYYFFQTNRWDLILKNNMTIKFPINNINEAILLSNKLLKKKEFKNLKIIDLRIDNKIITTSWKNKI